MLESLESPNTRLFGTVHPENLPGRGPLYLARGRTAQRDVVDFYQTTTQRGVGPAAYHRVRTGNSGKPRDCELRFYNASTHSNVNPYIRISETEYFLALLFNLQYVVVMLAPMSLAYALTNDAVN